MIGFFLAGAEVGIYNISVTLAGLLSLSLLAFNQMFPPVASSMYHAGDVDELNYGLYYRHKMDIHYCSVSSDYRVALRQEYPGRLGGVRPRPTGPYSFLSSPSLRTARLAPVAVYDDRTPVSNAPEPGVVRNTERDPKSHLYPRI